MTRRRTHLVMVSSLLILMWIILEGRAILADGRFHMAWWTVDGGGGTSTGGAYAIQGVIGQSDTGSMSSEQYSLNGGYWDAPGATPARDFVTYLPIAFRWQNGSAQAEGSGGER